MRDILTIEEAKQRGSFSSPVVGDCSPRLLDSVPGNAGRTHRQLEQQRRMLQTCKAAEFIHTDRYVRGNFTGSILDRKFLYSD